MRQCRICRSQILKEVDKLLQNSLSYREISSQLKEHFPEINLHALEQSVGRHHKGKHTPQFNGQNLAVLRQVYDLASSGQVTWDQFKEKVRFEWGLFSFSLGFDNFRLY